MMDCTIQPSSAWVNAELSILSQVLLEFKVYHPILLAPAQNSLAMAFPSIGVSLYECIRVRIESYSVLMFAVDKS